MRRELSATPQLFLPTDGPKSRRERDRNQSAFFAESRCDLTQKVLIVAFIAGNFPLG